MNSYVLTISYDGSRYFGWQKTKAGPTIQESLERAIAQITEESVIPEAASRTDRGVHATGQVVSFTLQKSRDPDVFLKELNAVLLQDIRVLKLERASSNFHPTLQARHKEYHYRICLGAVQNPVWRSYSWHFPAPIDLDRMQKVSLQFLGTQDFSALANRSEKNSICSLTAIRFECLEDQRLQIAMRGDRFLYKMARNLAGTLLYIGCKKIPAHCIPTLLLSKDRKQAGITAPAHGLFLYRVEY